jgi:transposase
MSLLERELTEDERRALEHLAGSRTEEHRLVERARIVLVASETSHMCDAARALDTDKHTIRRWSKRFLSEGLPGLRDKPRSGAPRRLTPEQIATVVLMAMTPPDQLGLPFGSWTQERLSIYLLEHEGIHISAPWVGEMLHREGMRWVQDEKWFSQKVDPEFLKKRGLSSKSTRTHLKGAS